MISMTPIIYLLIFVAVLLLVEGLYLMVFGKSISLNKRVNRRLEMLEKGERRDAVLERLRKEATQHQRARSIPLYSILATKAQKANIAFTPKALIAIMVGATFIAFAALSVASSAGIYIRIALSIGMGVGGVYFWVHSKAKKRMKLCEEQLPDAVELMVRSLRVGHPLASAILCCFYSANDVAAMVLGDDGMPVRISKLRGNRGKLQFTGPLDSE